MMRVLEFLVALAIVAVVGLVVGVALPSHGHIERTQVIGKDLRQVYDVLNNFGDLPDYAELSTAGEKPQFTDSGKAFGTGAEVSWTSSDPKKSGQLSIASVSPAFDQITTATSESKIVWNVNNAWRGDDKHFTLDLKRQGSRGQLTSVTWAYDVDYGWNLASRYSYLFINGSPAAFIQFSLNGLQSLLGSIPNTDYTDLVPYVAPAKPTPVLAISATSPRKEGLDALNGAIDGAVKQLNAEAKKLGVNVTGPRIVFTTDYGDTTVAFDVALPIDASSINLDGQAHALTAYQVPALAAAGAASAAAPAASAPAAAASSATAAASEPAAGDTDRYNRLVLGHGISAYLALNDATLSAKWVGNGAGVPLTRDMLRTYAQTHGYKFDDVVAHPYDILEPKADGQSDDQRVYEVYLPLKAGAPTATPEQEAGKSQLPASDASAAAPAAAGTAAAPAAAGSTAG